VLFLLHPVNRRSDIECIQLIAASTAVTATGNSIDSKISKAGSQRNGPTIVVATLTCLHCRLPYRQERLYLWHFDDDAAIADVACLLS
jgi:hypothetical protein